MDPYNFPLYIATLSHDQYLLAKNMGGEKMGVYFFTYRFKNSSGLLNITTSIIFDTKIFL